MNNRNNMMTSLLAIGATGAIIYGVTRGIQNGTFKRLQQPVSNVLENAQQTLQSNQQGIQQLTSKLQNNVDGNQDQSNGNN